MKRTVLLTTILLCLYANVIAESGVSHSKTNEINNYIVLNDNLEDFEKISLLKSVLDHCSTSEIISKRESLASFIVEYSQHIIKKNKIADDEVIRTIVDSELAVQNKFGNDIPTTICSEAFIKSSIMSQNWTETKKKKVIVNENTNDENNKLNDKINSISKKKLMVMTNKIKDTNEFI